MGKNQKNSSIPHLVWVSPETPNELCSVARLHVTRELRRLGWQVTLIGTGPTGRCHIQGVEIFCVPRPQVYFLGVWIFHLYVLRFIAREWACIDAIMFHQKSAFWLLYLRFIRSLNNGDGPLLVMDTRTIPMTVATRKARARAMFTNLMNQLANRWADGQTAITYRMAQSVNIPAGQLWGSWPSGVNLDQFRQAQITRQWPLPSMPIYLIYVGSLYRERNLMALCQAVVAANNEGMTFVLSIVGDGPERFDLKEFAKETRGQIRVMPPVPHENVPALLAQAHVGVLPFPDEEKFRVSSPIKLFEYMAAGLPILATRIACHTDVVGEGEFVFWVEGDSGESFIISLRQVWEARSSLQSMGIKARTAANSWTWEASAGKLSDALKHGIAKQQVKSDYLITG